jgi:hypothetical protein
MINEVVQKFITSVSDNILNRMKIDGELKPHFTILTENNGEPKYSLIPIPEFLLEDEVGKDFVKDVLLKTIKDKVKSDGNKLLCVCMGSESWMYKSSKEELEKVNGEYRKLPRQEVVTLNFDFGNGNKFLIYDVIRMMNVDGNGLNEVVDLKLMEEKDDIEGSVGRFSKLM